MLPLPIARSSGRSSADAPPSTEVVGDHPGVAGAGFWFTPLNSFSGMAVSAKTRPMNKIVRSMKDLSWPEAAEPAATKQSCNGMKSFLKQFSTSTQHCGNGAWLTIRAEAADER
jgi:hypothetical protein